MRNGPPDLDAQAAQLVTVAAASRRVRLRTDRTAHHPLRSVTVTAQVCTGAPTAHPRSQALWRGMLG
jgi:hypothetical protein